MAVVQGQGFPLASPLLDENGNISLAWIRFFLTLYNRLGGSNGVANANLSALFNFPLTAGTAGQTLISHGASQPTTWTNLATKLSQLTNDAGFISLTALNTAIAGLLDTNAVNAVVNARESNTIPPPIGPAGAAGVSTDLARADHAHARESAPSYSSVLSPIYSTGLATWTAGAHAPLAVQPNGSIYSNTSGTTGSRLYVSNGTTWAAVSGV